MKTAMSRPDESHRLEDLGRASMQIVHDLKNQLNGLKLYATFLRRRIEKTERPGDEQETIGKLITGLDRAAEDLSALVRYAQPVDLKKQPGFEVDKVLSSICSNLNGTNTQIACAVDSGSVQGSFDHFKLTDALKWLSIGALKYRQTGDGASGITVKVAQTDTERAVVEWSGLRKLDQDPIHSFAGVDEVKMALAAKIIDAHGGSTEFTDRKFVVVLPLSG
jgi:signal transduction histidine kinase